MSISKIAQWNTTDQNPDYGWYNSRKAGVIREKCVLSAAGASYTLKQKLPGSTRRLWAMLHYGTAPSFTWAATHNSPTGAVVLTDVAPTSLNGTVTTDIFVLGSTTLSANTKVVDPTPDNSKDTATSTSEVTLYLVPYAATTSASNTTRFATNYTFAATADVYVTVFFDSYEGSPNV